MFTEDQITRTTGDGREYATINVDSSNLPHVTVDTYQTFNGDSWLECEMFHLIDELGYRPGEVDFTYDHSGILRDLSIAANEAVSDALYHADEIDGVQVVRVGDVSDTFGPAYYNFTTDSYSADYTIDLAAMEAWVKDRGWDHHDYGLEHFSSRSGFASFVPSWLERGDMEQGVRLWLFLHAYLSEVLDHDRMFYAVAEAEHEAYSDNTTLSLDCSEVEKRLAEELAARTGLDVGYCEGLIPAGLTEGLEDSMAWDFDEYREWLDGQLAEVISTNGPHDNLAREAMPSPWLGSHIKTMAALA